MAMVELGLLCSVCGSRRWLNWLWLVVNPLCSMSTGFRQNQGSKLGSPYSPHHPCNKKRQGLPAAHRTVGDVPAAGAAGMLAKPASFRRCATRSIRPGDGSGCNISFPWFPLPPDPQLNFAAVFRDHGSHERRNPGRSTLLEFWGYFADSVLFRRDVMCRWTAALSWPLVVRAKTCGCSCRRRSRMSSRSSFEKKASLFRAFSLSDQTCPGLQ